MQPGIFGWSLILEVLIFYYAWNLWFSNVDRRWVYLVLGVIALIAVSSPSSGEWAEVFAGHFDFLWKEVFSNFGFR